MIVDLPDTDTGALCTRLADLRERGGVVALSRVLNLVIVVDEVRVEPAVQAANEASHEHPCRVLAVVLGSGRGRARLDAQIRVGGDAGASEVLLLRAAGPLTGQCAALVTPLLLSDVPLVAWWPGESPTVPSEDVVGSMAVRRITDAAAARRPVAELSRRAATHRPGDSDLAWSRLTRWRALLAAALDQVPWVRVREGRVVAAATSPSAELLAGWLAWALGVPVRRQGARGAEGIVSAHLRVPDGWLNLVRPDGSDIATLTFPGRPGVPVALARRGDAECLAEELRRLDADEVLGDVLRHGLPAVTRSSARPSSGARPTPTRPA